MKLSRFPLLRRTAIGSAALIALAGFAGSVSAQTTAPAGVNADSAQKSVELAPAPLAVTLKALGDKFGTPVRFDESAVTDKRSRGVSGFYTVQEALIQALRGTGLVAVTQEGGLRVVDQGVAGTLQRVTIVARRDQAETEFKADRSDTSTRSGASLMEVPQSVTILTSKLLESQQVVTVQDALANVSGVVLTNNVQGTPYYSIRGFSDYSNALVNGTESAFGTSAALVTVERLEVLKGPQAILAGNGFPGGAVNVVLKKPQAAPIKEVSVQYSSFDDTQATGDFSGALAGDNRLSYRLTGSVDSARKADGGYDGRKENAFLPQLRWKDASLDVTAGLSYLDNHVPFSNYTLYLPAAGSKPGAILQRPNFLLANQGDGFDLTERKAFYNGEYAFGHGFTLVSRLQRSLDKQKLNAWLPQQRGPFDQANPSIFFVASSNAVDTRTTSGDHYLRVEADTGPIAHTLSVGINHSDVTTRTAFGQDPGFGGINVDVTSSAQPAFPVTSSYPANRVAVNTVKQRGEYLQDTLRWGDVTALLSWRHLRYEQESTSTLNGKPLTPGQNTYSKNDPAVGLVYSLTPSASVYANLMKGTNVTFATTICGAPKGDPAPPKNYTNKEIGGKLDLLDNRLSVTSALFQLDETNVITYNPSGACYTLIPAQRTKGVEFDVQGRLAPGLNVVANYSNSLVHDLTTPTTAYYGHPRGKGSVWLNYDVLSGPLQGAGAGLGVVANSGSYTNTFGQPPAVVPHAVSLNASLSYRINGWAVLLGVKNLTDRLNYGPSVAYAYIPIQPGRTYALTLRKSFE